MAGVQLRQTIVPIHLPVKRHIAPNTSADGADLLNKRVGREIGQEQRGDEHVAKDGFDAI
jgi:hypothetical protein